ncbi:MAG: hypothetical protein HC831_20270 [Chloroflexia bacterium]|nr:hypothetical protein [Chloroflexia bacterium]
MGIVIYRSDLDRFFAFERTCSYYPNDTSAVEIEKGSNILYCPKCGSKYVITEDEAMVLQGPANMSLKSYRTFINSNRLYITN